MSNAKLMLSCKNVSIRYRVGDFKNIGLKEWVMRRLTGKYKVIDFWADKDISFEINEGDMLGIIGTNGAGKSTLLKAVTGIMEPTKGRIIRNGKVSALLELASGFDGDLTVKENAYLRGAMLGYTRKFMDETYPYIIEFSELKEFEDRPFKQLSSGMKSRLAFAIASLVKPEILILDEVLSVGDGAFRAKSEAKMREIIKGGATTILVSHSIHQVRTMCNKVLWLDGGKMVAFSDDPSGICNAYNRFLKLGSLGGFVINEALTMNDVANAMPSVTVIVTSHRNADALRVTLNSIMKQRGVAFEVIVVSGVDDQNSIDNVVAEFPKIIYEKNRKFDRLSLKILHGIENASGKYLFIIDDDGCLVDDTFLSNAVGRLDFDSGLSFVSGTVRISDETKNNVKCCDTKYPVLGKVKGLEYFQEFQIGSLPKPYSTCCTVFRKRNIIKGGSLIECSDSSIYLKSLLHGDAYLMPNLVAKYRVWRGSVAKGVGFGCDFKLNVLKQKELLFEMSKGKIRDSLSWWVKTFQMNFNYFNKTSTDRLEKSMLAQWGLQHTHGSKELEDYCQAILKDGHYKG